MRKYLLLGWSLFIVSSKSFAFPALKTGDIILLPLHCWVCSLIELEHDTIFSHAGIVYRNPQSEDLFVLESWGETKMTPIKEFLERTQKEQAPKYMRNKEIAQLGAKKYQEFKAGLINSFKKDFEHLEYDRDFLWDNKDKIGRDKLYCTEFITKILNPFLTQKIETYPMTFQKNRYYWDRYFNAQTPEGRPGNAPAHIERSPLFFEITSSTP